MQRFLGLGRLPLWRGRFFLRPFICAAPTQAVAVFAHLQLSRLWYFRTNASNRCSLRIPLLFISLLWWCFIWCVDSGFLLAGSCHGVHYASFSMLASPPTCIPRSFCHSLCSRFSGFSTSSIGHPLVQAFRSSVGPSFSVIRWSKLFGHPLVQAFRSSVGGVI